MGKGRGDGEAVGLSHFSVEVVGDVDVSDFMTFPFDEEVVAFAMDQGVVDHAFELALRGLGA